MKIIWERGSATVRDVYEALLERRKIAYTTVMTMMGILESKAYLTKQSGEKAYVYSPAEPQKKVVGNMVGDFVNRVFNGSAKPLVLHLIESRQVSQEELEEIALLLKKKKVRK